MNKKNLTVIHMHIMKTAGMALNKKISEYYKSRNAFVDQGNLGGYPSVTTVNEKFDYLVNNYDFIAGHFNFVGTTQIKRAKLEQGFNVVDFTILRNPIKRSVSTYRFYVKEFFNSPEMARKYHGSYLYDLFLKDQISFEDFVNKVPSHIKDFQTRFLSNLQHDQMWNFSPPIIDKIILEQAMKNLHSFKLIGIQEDLDSFWMKLCDVCGWYYDGPLNVVNSSSEINKTTIPPYMVDITITEKTKSKLEELLYHDLKLYEYALKIM